MLQELQAAKKSSIWDTMVLAVLMEIAVLVPGLCQLESKKIILLCDELLFHSYTLCKILALLVLALRALRALRTLSISNSGDSFLGLLPVCTLPATGVSSASRALAQKGSSWEQKSGISILLYK